MTMTEAEVKTQIKAFLNSIPQCWYFMPVPMGYGVRGIPDFIGVCRGIFFAIEAKSSIGKASPWQEKIHKLIIAAGGLVITTSKIEEVHDLFREIQRMCVQSQPPSNS